MTKPVTRSILDFYDQYEGDFGLLCEPWAPQKDRDRFDAERAQCQALGEYEDALYFVRVEALSAELRARTQARIDELEHEMEDEVIDILRRRVEQDCACRMFRGSASLPVSAQLNAWQVIALSVAIGSALVVAVMSTASSPDYWGLFRTSVPVAILNGVASMYCYKTIPGWRRWLALLLGSLTFSMEVQFALRLL